MNKIVIPWYFFRFLPNGIYLDAYKLGVKGLAKEMNDIINNSHRYYDFFKWHNYYDFHDTGADGYRHSICAFCAFLNNEVQGYKRTMMYNILRWWNAFTPDEFPNSARPTYTTSSLTTQEIHIESLPMATEKNAKSALSNIFDFFLNYE